MELQKHTLTQEVGNQKHTKIDANGAEGWCIQIEYATDSKTT